MGFSSCCGFQLVHALSPLTSIFPRRFCPVDFKPQQQTLRQQLETVVPNRFHIRGLLCGRRFFRAWWGWLRDDSAQNVHRACNFCSYYLSSAAERQALIPEVETPALEHGSHLHHLEGFSKHTLLGPLQSSPGSWLTSLPVWGEPGYRKLSPFTAPSPGAGPGPIPLFFPPFCPTWFCADFLTLSEV